MKFSKLLSYAFVGLLTFNISCNSDGDAPVLPKGAYENGILVSNEGNFGKPNSEVSFIDGKLSAITNDIFGTENSGAKLGDVLNSAYFSGDNGYLVVNNSNKVEVVNRYTFKKVTEITEQLKLPRFATSNGNYLYVTNSSDNSVNIYSLKDNSFVKKIKLTDSVERIVSAGKNVFVQNAAWGYGNTITEISSEDNSVKKVITVASGDIAKVISYNNNVFAVAGSKSLGDSFIYQYNENGELLKSYTLKGISNAQNLAIDKNKMYFTSGTGVYSMAIGEASSPSKPLFNVTDSSWSTLYGFDVIDDKIYTSDAKGFTEGSEVSVYNTSGTLLKTFKAGMGTNGFYKN